MVENYLDGRGKRVVSWRDNLPRRHKTDVPKHLYQSWAEGGRTDTRYDRTKSWWLDAEGFDDLLHYAIFRRLNEKKSYGKSFIVSVVRGVHTLVLAK